MTKAEFLGLLRALNEGFSDWHYDHQPARLQPDGRLALPGFDAVPATAKSVAITEHDFFHRGAGELIAEIRPDPGPGGAPRGIFEQIGVELPPLWSPPQPAP